MNTDDYFFKEDKTELDKFLHQIAIKGYENLWAPDFSNGEVRNITDYLASVRGFNAQIPPYALEADGERMLPFWVYQDCLKNNETEVCKSLEVCIDYSKLRGFHIKDIHVCKVYPNNDSTLVDVTLNSPHAKLPGVIAIWRFANRVDDLRKQQGIKYLNEKCNSEDIAIGRRLKKIF